MALSVLDVRQRRPLNLLLLAGADENWTRVVQDAANFIGDVPIQRVFSVNEAISRLVLGDPDYSHLLVKSELAGDRITDLAQLTAGESHSATSLVMLGAQGAVPPRSCVVAQADSASLTETLVSRTATRRARVPALQPEELQAALSGARLRTRYQPIVRLCDHASVGLEVLARLDHPAHGTLSPGHFLPQMEQAGLARRLTQIVVERAFADHSAYFADLGFWLAVNIPLDVLMDEPSMRWLEQRRCESGIPAADITIELTESRPVGALDTVGLGILQRAIARLRALGYGLAIDDFGPSMTHPHILFELDLTAIKLDKDFVGAAGDDAAAHDFLMQTLRTAHAAGLVVVAEGVKDEATWRLMRDAGADHAQGFMVARPLPAAAVPIWHQVWHHAWHGQTH